MSVRRKSRNDKHHDFGSAILSLRPAALNRSSAVDARTLAIHGLDAVSTSCGNQTGYVCGRGLDTATASWPDFCRAYSSHFGRHAGNRADDSRMRPNCCANHCAEICLRCVRYCPNTERLLPGECRDNSWDIARMLRWTHAPYLRERLRGHLLVVA